MGFISCVWVCYMLVCLGLSAVGCGWLLEEYGGEVWGLCGGLTVGLCCFLMIAYNIVSYYFRVMKRNTKHVN